MYSWPVEGRGPRPSGNIEKVRRCRWSAAAPRRCRPNELAPRPWTISEHRDLCQVAQTRVFDDISGRRSTCSGWRPPLDRVPFYVLQVAATCGVRVGWEGEPAPSDAGWLPGCLERTSRLATLSGAILPRGRPHRRPAEGRTRGMCCATPQLIVLCRTPRDGGADTLNSSRRRRRRRIGRRSGPIDLRGGAPMDRHSFHVEVDGTATRPESREPWCRMSPERRPETR